MKRNVGSTDRVARLAAAPLLLLLGVVAGPGGWLSVLLYGAAGIMAVTGAVGFCPLYAALGLSTRGSAFPLGQGSRPAREVPSRR
jgi:hypothetical protein